MTRSDRKLAKAIRLMNEGLDCISEAFQDKGLQRDWIDYATQEAQVVTAREIQSYVTALEVFLIHK